MSLDSLFHSTVAGWFQRSFAVGDTVDIVINLELLR